MSVMTRRQAVRALAAGLHRRPIAQIFGGNAIHLRGTIWPA